MEEDWSVDITNSSKVALDPPRPWNYASLSSIGNRDWWDDNVREQAVLHLAKVVSAANSIDDGTVQPDLQGDGRFQTPRRGTVSQSGRVPDGTAYSPAKAAGTTHKGRSTYDAELLAEKDAKGFYIRNNEGVFVREDISVEKCGKQGSECPEGHRHPCKVCLSNSHSGADHHSSNEVGKCQDKFKGKGKGKRKT